MNKGIQEMFTGVPRTYELVNHVLTFGLDILWRRRAVKVATNGGGTKWLDMCSGTGEMALYLRRSGGEDVTVFAADFSFPMLKNLKDKPEAQHIVCTLAEATQLPFPDNTFDLVTISFATRNINVNREILILCIREFKRIVKPGGQFVNLETSQPPLRFIRWLIHIYVRLFVRPIGFIISRSGFSEVTFQRLFLGVTAIHKAVK
jgi:demethylmenaquinone methyltransferase/2-methoxy-6-polyprenyl-1,4-benzoquinol methylase